MEKKSEKSSASVMKMKLGFYVTTNIADKTISIGIGRKAIILDAMQANLLNELLSHKIQLLSDK